MKIEIGKIYELSDGWGPVRVIGMRREYHQFNPHKPGDLQVKLLNMELEEPTPFLMKLKDFEKKIKKCHGYSLP